MLERWASQTLRRYAPLQHIYNIHEIHHLVNTGGPGIW